MGLFPEINEELTIKNVKRFFNPDKGSYWRVVEVSGILVSSPKADITGVSGSVKGNSQEEKNIKLNIYKKIIKAVEYAIDCCLPPSKEILTYRYIQRLSVWQTKQHLKLDSNDSYSKRDRSACLAFARTFEYSARVKYKIPYEDLSSFLTIEEN